MARRRGTPDRGQASVELALLLPVVAILLLAVLQVGLVAREVVLVTHAAREAARAAATDPDPTAARAAALSSGGLDPERLVVTTTRSKAGRRVRVDVAYRAATGVPLIGSLVGDRTIRAHATMRVEVPPARFALNFLAPSTDQTGTTQIIGTKFQPPAHPWGEDPRSPRRTQSRISTRRSLSPTPQPTHQPGPGGYPWRKHRCSSDRSPS